MITFKILGAFLAATSAAISATPELNAKTSSRDLVVLETRDLVVRDQHKKTFDLGWQIKDRPIFSAQWTGAVTRGPSTLSETTKISVECLDCRTWGTITAELNTDHDLLAYLNFTKVGGYFDFGLAASTQGTYVFQLHSGVGDKNNITKSGWHLDLGLTAEFIIQVSASVEVSGGFQFEVVDGSTGLTIGVPEVWDVNVLPLPKVDFGLLPVSLNDTAANITAAIRFRAHSGVTGEVLSKDISGEAGAFLNLAQVTLRETSSSSSAGDCKQAFSVDVEANAGAYARMSVCDEENHGGGGRNCTGDGPKAATVFYQGGTTACLPTATGKPFRPTAAAIAGPASCDGGAPAATGETVTTSTYQVVRCAVATINCPPAYQQTIEATNVETVTTTSCPGAVATDAVAMDVAVADKIEHPIRLASTSSRAPTVDTDGIPTPVATVIAGQYAAWAKELEEEKDGGKDGGKDEKNSASVLWQSQNGLLSLLGFFFAVMIWL